MLVESKSGNKLTGIYRGVVLKHCDNGKCKVYIPGIYDDKTSENPDLLPDAEQAVGIQESSINCNGIITYPMIGSYVWCIFQNNDQNYPVMFAATQGGTSQQVFNNDQIRGHVDIIDKNGGLDYKCSKPIVYRRHCRSVDLEDRNGTIIQGMQRNLFNSNIDLPRSEYSHSMHIFNLIKSQIGSDQYFLYSNAENIEKTTLDDLYVKQIKHFTSTADNDYKWFSDLSAYDSGTCIGIIGHSTSPKSDEDGFTQGLFEQFKPTTCSNSRGLYNNYLRPTFSARPSCIGISNTMICADGSTKWLKLFQKSEVNKRLSQEKAKKKPNQEKIKLFELLLLDLYICNGAQYGFVPEYWDKHFAGSYPAMCPKATIPPPVLADVAKYDTNIILIDPILVESFNVKLNDGTQVSYLLDHETEFETRTTIKNGSEQIQKFKQMCEKYCKVQSEISAYHAYDKNDTFDALDFSEVFRKHEHVDGEMWDLSCINNYDFKYKNKKDYIIDCLSSVWVAPDVNTRVPYQEKYETPDSGDKKLEYIIQHKDHYIEKDLHTLNSIQYIKYNNNSPICEIREVNNMDADYLSGNLSIEIVRLENNNEKDFVRLSANRDGEVQIHITNQIKNTFCSLTDKENYVKSNIKSDGTTSISATNCINVDVGKGNYTLNISKDGSVVLNAVKSLKFTVGSSVFEMTSDGKINMTADVTITGKLHVTADQTNDATIVSTGDITSNSNITAKGKVTDSGCCLATHTHTEMQAGDVVAPGETSTGH